MPGDDTGEAGPTPNASQRYVVLLFHDVRDTVDRLVYNVMHKILKKSHRRF